MTKDLCQKVYISPLKTKCRGGGEERYRVKYEQYGNKNWEGWCKKRGLIVTEEKKLKPYYA